MLKNKKFQLIVAFFALLFVLVACGNDDNDNDTGSDDANVGEEGSGDDATGVGVSGASDEVIVAIPGELPTLDPHAENMLAASQVNVHVLSTLVNQDADLQIYPGLAHSWEQLDELTWQFNLRDYVYFHNGDKMTAEHVQFSLARAAEAPRVAPVVGMIDANGFEIVDDYTIIIRTEYPFAPFLNHLAHNASAVLNMNVLGDVIPGEASNDLIVGTGPYQIIQHTSGDRLVMERWDDYWGELPNMRLITYRIMTDPSARTFALETGDVDIIMNPLATDISRLENDSNFTVPYVTGLGVEYMMMNNERIPNPLVRQAINYALDVPSIVQVTTEGTFDPAYGFVNQVTFGHNPNFEGFPFDVERARDLMIEAGYSGERGANDLSIDLFANSENMIRTQSAEIIANQLYEIGIDVDIRTMEFNTIMEEFVTQRQADMALLGWGTVTGDADYALFPLFHSSAHSPSTNHSLFYNPEFDDLIERARVSSDPDERLALYWEAQDILREYAPWVLLSNNIVRLPAQNNIGGIVVMAHQSHFFGNIYFTD